MPRPGVLRRALLRRGIIWKSLACVGACLLFLRSGMGTAPSPSPSQEYTRYTTMTGFFLQDDPATDSKTFDYTKMNLGLIDRPYDTDAEYDAEREKTPWQRFEYQVLRLNRESGRGGEVRYKVLIMGRHGEGYHNVAESFYGTPAWDCYWSLQDGNGTITWSDAQLTPTGIKQALSAHDFWATALPTALIPAPESYYSSPLARCLATAHLTFNELALPPQRPFLPTIKELFREEIGAHTCDRRGTKTAIHAAYPEWRFEPAFTETDELWSPHTRETESAQDFRTKGVLDEVFAGDDATWISITSHSGEIASILRVLGHRSFTLNTGAVIPVLVKAEVVSGTAPTATIEPYTTVSACATPPPMPTV